MKKTEIYILSGFLGSGKTTLLKQLLHMEKQLKRKVAVMMNEFGKISIDSDSIDGDIPLKELLNGCICCTIQDKLEAQLQGLLIEEKPDVIYIETTGAAHPVEVLDAVLSPLFAEKITMKGIITIVDGKRWLDRKALNPQLQQLLLEQVRHADTIMINKADLLTEAEKGQLTFEIQSINATALCILTSYSKVSLETLQTQRFVEKKKSSTAHVHHSLNLTSFVYQFQHSINKTAFEQFLRELPETVYRIKGYVSFHHSKYPYLFQFSYGMPIYMKENMKMPLNLVFIGENLNIELLNKKLTELDLADETIH
ncbi:GTP-binding protein [Bacillus aquiflavi]|uniref:GTP-binding protein n=1 Tax=Bacillus aquiflavi TaxID=2672567 RepID=A0A6B3VUR5_9BACI|nr:GTP-binding protein [Bacillus aquiflavi]MBA4537743.1 GTP-binding protein [Bacillus aquiflavi]NEY82000.1 GTP-binding protein [Bacillus aquiflavi]